MIKIVSGIDPKTGGYNPKLWSSHKKTENFMSEEALSSGAKSSTVGSFFYSIHFVENYHVFSAHTIVRDSHGADRVGTLTFSIALLGKNKINILQELHNFKNAYINNSIESGNVVPDAELKLHKKSRQNTSNEKMSVYLFYNDEVIKKCFCVNSNYTKFKRIFFIDEGYSNQNFNPLLSIQKDVKKVSVEELQEPLPVEIIKEKKIKRFAKNYTLEYSLFIFFVGIVIGMGGLWLYQDALKRFGLMNNSTYNKTCTAQKNTEIQLSNDSICTPINTHENTPSNSENSSEANQIVNNQRRNNNKNANNTAIREETAKNAGNARNAGNDGNSGRADNTSKLIPDVKQFLETDCKTMTLQQINEKNALLLKTQNSKNLFGFENFRMLLINNNPLTKEKIEKYKKDNSINFNDNDEYVKFIKYLATLDDEFLEIKPIEKISNKTLREIEEHYGYFEK